MWYNGRAMFEIRTYQTADGSRPYDEWLSGLDAVAARRVRARVARIGIGAFGDSKMLADAGGVCELRLKFGPGYRVYYGKDGATIVLLLCGGNKSTQKRDVAKAAGYWKEYRERKVES